MMFTETDIQDVDIAIGESVCRAGMRLTRVDGSTQHGTVLANHASLAVGNFSALHIIMCGEGAAVYAAAKQPTHVVVVVAKGARCLITHPMCVCSKLKPGTYDVAIEAQDPVTGVQD